MVLIADSQNASPRGDGEDSLLAPRDHVNVPVAVITDVKLARVILPEGNGVVQRKIPDTSRK